MGWMKGRGLTKIACPKCDKEATGTDFGDDNRMEDDLGIAEHYRCGGYGYSRYEITQEKKSGCGQYYTAYLRYATIEAED